MEKIFNNIRRRVTDFDSKHSAHIGFRVGRMLVYMIFKVLYVMFLFVCAVFVAPSGEKKRAPYRELNPLEHPINRGAAGYNDPDKL